MLVLTVSTDLKCNRVHISKLAVVARTSKSSQLLGIHLIKHETRRHSLPNQHRDHPRLLLRVARLDANTTSRRQRRRSEAEVQQGLHAEETGAAARKHEAEPLGQVAGVHVHSECTEEQRARWPAKSRQRAHVSCMERPGRILDVQYKLGLKQHTAR